ncbi:MAG TPA: Ig-like domain-containing protein [Methylomirabilota bacterium]|nr:Ig-like domain-containing protein [Methylomirabilota bacterium]
MGNSTSITAHELGHNLGFPHANFWETGGESAIGPGGNQEYGDPYDVMGGGSASGGTGPGHYVAKFKWYIGWIDDEHFPRVTTSGTYRIYAHDTPDATGLRGVRFQRDGALDYHLEFRRLYTSNPWLMNGIGLRWGSRTGSSSQLIDTTPGSPDGKTDSAIVIGRTFSDPDAGVHITPIRLGNTYPESIDVVLNFGTFPGNRRPSGLVSASPTVTAAGGTVTLRMEATDPDGDALAYYWDFDDGTFGANSPTVTKNWGAAGDYSVRCTVSDMKGGTYSESVLVRVGNPATFQISGRVLGPEGPVADVLIRAGSRTTYSDSDGTYTLTRLSAGSYTVSAQLYPHTFVSPFFSNPVSVGPNAANIDFISVTAPQDDVTLVANGSVWKYLANGSNQGAAWRAAAYNDAAWPSGPAQLGYGDGDEATVVSYGPDANNKYITTYFRRAFTVANSAGLTNFTLSILRDDGAAVYLNGVEVLRDNLPAGASYNTTAIDNSEDTTVVGINPSLVLPGTNVLAVEVHQVSPTSSDLSFDLSFTATTITNFSGLSAFYIASPADRAVFNEGATVTVATRALSTGHPFTRVEFFADGARIGEDTTAPFTLDWAAPSVGHHVLTARATDAASNVSTAAPVRITIERPPVETLLIAAGSEWRYLDDGSNQGSAWRQPDFDDSGWSVGPAELGYGDADEATVVRYGPSAANKYITTYFRRTFEVEDPTIITNLVLGLLRDDGAVVYLNGVEAYRNNLPAGPIAYNTLAVTAVEDDDTFLSANLDPALLVVGPNVIAVEIHQQAVNSSDISFDLRLAAQVTEPRPPGVYLAAPASGSSLEAPVSPEIAAIAMPAPGENTVSVAFYANGLLLGEDASAPYGWSWINPAPGVYSLSALALGSGGTLHTSAPVVVTITAPPAGRQLISPGAAWRYLDDGSNAGTAWRSRTFNDSGWRMGYARLGYGGDGEQTTVGYGPDATRRFITTYFRHAFTLTSLADIERLRLSLSADDGAVVYLNGAEVHRQNLGAGAVSHNSLALSDVSGAAETAFTDVALSPSTLVIGTNVIAVEVHLFRTNDTDLGFDLALVAETSPAGLGEVYLISPAEGAEFTLPGGVALEAFASAPGDTVTEVEFLANGASVGADATVPYAMNWNPLVGSYELSAVAHLAGGGSRTSAPVRITVSAPPLVVASVLTTFKPSAAQWRYLSSDAPSGWTLPDFNDSAWAQGRARLGWGLDGEATTLPSGRITHYFRSTFAVDNPALYDTLILQLQRDDGAVVYLNGFELVRSNMPNGPITASTLALATLDGRDEQEFGITTMPAAGLTAGTNVIAVELHQASATSSDGGFDLHLSGSGNTAPRVVLGSPVNNAFFAVPAVVPIEAYVWPGSGRTVARVEFFANGAKLGERTAPPYRFNWNNPVAGRHTLRARARDSFGDTIESAVASIEVGQPTVSSNFVRAGSVWKYLDTGVNLGASWAQPAFNDAGWPSGPAQLGYGDNDEATRVNFGPSSTSKYITTYFRRRFEVPPGMVFTNLTFRLLRDDGAVVWLNGREAFRSNMPASGTIAFNTLASASVGGADESTFFVTSLTITNLPVGTNVVAVEVHQNAPDSSDISFDLELIATGYAQPITPPEVALRRLEDGRVEISWPASATGWLLHSSPNLEPGSWTRVSDAPTLISGRYVVTVNPAQADTTFYRLQR